MSEERDIRLRIADNLHKRVSASAIQEGIPGADAETISQVRRLMRKGLIHVDRETGKASYAEGVTEEDIEAFLSGEPARKKTKPTTQAADEAASEVIRKRLVGRTKEEMEQIIILGEASQQAYFNYAAKKGLNINEMRRQPLHKITTQAYKALDENPKLQERIEELEVTTSFFQARANPFWRMERGIELLRDFMELSVYYEMLGIDILDSDISQFYGRQIDRFLIGGETI